MKSLATLPGPGTFPTGEPGELLVGRLVANAEFVRALHRHGSFEEFLFFVGERREEDPLVRTLVDRLGMDGDRIRVLNRLRLPAALAAGRISVLHQLSHVDAFSHLLVLRDRCAGATVPVTAQVHALSYPRLMQSYFATLLWPPAAHDAVFCSSEAGRRVVEAAFASARAACERSFGGAPGLAWELPVIPLGVDVDSLGRGDRDRTRHELGLPADALVVLVMARFSEHDKMDLLPALQVFSALLANPIQPARPLYLLLAGARQDAGAPEMVTRWAARLGIANRLVTRVDFSRAEQPGLLAAADIFLSPADNVQETFGLSVAEAMAAGLPVIASDFDGYRELITGETGILLPTRWAADPDWLTDLAPVLYERPLHLLLGQSIEVDLPAMARALNDLARDDTRREAMGRAARARARARFDWRVVIRAYEEVWRRLAAKPFRPERPGREPAPLAMSYRALFAHYPSVEADTERIVRRLPLADALCGPADRYPVYPELEEVFDEEDVTAAVGIATEPVAVDQLSRALEARWPPCEAWRARILVAWLLKHGLLG